MERYAYEDCPSMHWCGWCLLLDCAFGSSPWRHPWCLACLCHGGGHLLNDGEPAQWLLSTGGCLVRPLCGEGGVYRHFHPQLRLCPFPMCHRGGAATHLLSHDHLCGSSLVAILVQTRREGDAGATVKEAPRMWGEITLDSLNILWFQMDRRPPAQIQCFQTFPGKPPVSNEKTKIDKEWWLVVENLPLDHWFLSFCFCSMPGSGTTFSGQLEACLSSLSDGSTVIGTWMLRLNTEKRWSGPADVWKPLSKNKCYIYVFNVRIPRQCQVFFFIINPVRRENTHQLAKLYPMNMNRYRGSCFN